MAIESEKDAFLSLIMTHKGILLKVANSYCRDPHDREDLVQEMLLQLWKSYARYDPNYRFTTWMYRVALNTAISHYREGRRRAEVLARPVRPAEQADSGSDARGAEIVEMPEILSELPGAEEQSGLLHRCIRELKELDRALILLYFEERSYREIAEILGITETNAATKVGRIKERLKQRLQERTEKQR